MTPRRIHWIHIFTIVVCLSMARWSSPILAAELLGYWQLEETDINDEAVDSSGNGLNGFYEGGVDPDVEGAPGFGSGAHFDGASGQVYIGPGDFTGFGDLTSDFTVMAWMNPEQFDSKNRVFGSAPLGSGWGWGTIRDELEITTYGVKDYDQPVPLELDDWTHAAIVLDDNFEAHFYVNGEFIGTQTHPSEGTPTINDFTIGYSCCAPEYFEGRLDEVAVFSGALTDEEIVNAMTFGASNFEGGGAGVLQAGDADQDFDFDQLDIVQVSVAAKYLSGDPATWGEGDWDGAPGGQPGSPPAGNGFFDQVDIIAALSAGIYLTGSYNALAPGGNPNDEQTSLIYDAGSGELSVDAPASTELTSVFVTSAGNLFVGDKPPVLDGPFDSFGPDNIFKSTIGGSFGDSSFGNVLPSGLSEADVAADLSASGSLAGGGGLGEVDLVYVPEPASVLSLVFGIAIGILCTGRVRR